MKLSNRSLFTGDCTYLFVGHLFNPGGGPYTAGIVHDHIESLVRLCDNRLDLLEAKIDWVAECARACRVQGIAPWLTIRMNAVFRHPSSVIRLLSLSSPPLPLMNQACRTDWRIWNPGISRTVHRHYGTLRLATSRARDRGSKCRATPSCFRREDCCCDRDLCDER